MPRLKLSIIIPVFNEAPLIENQLHYLSSVFGNNCEIIVVDGGSTDDTVALAKPLANFVVASPIKSRAEQMNAGAAVASGDIFLFLHSDTRPPQNASDSLTSVEDAHWGFFKVKLSGSALIFRIVGCMMNLRSGITHVATGDQCIFVGRRLFEKNEGYASIPLMEDVELCKRLRKQIAPVVIDRTAVTSSRRWENKGVLKTILLMWRLRFLYFMGVAPKKLGTQYYS